MGNSAGKAMNVEHAICRIVEETSGPELTLKYFGPGCLVKFESTEFLGSVGIRKSNYFLVASTQVLRKVHLGTLQKKSGPSVIMVAEFQDLKVRGKLERKPLNELYSSLEEDVFECGGITYVALTKLRASGFRKSSLLSRALEGMCSLATSDQLQCIVLCNERRINRENRDMDELSTKVYDLPFDSILRDESRFPSHFLRNEEQKRFVRKDEFQNCDGEPLGSIILTRDAKFGGVLNFIENQPAPAFVGSGFGTAASERHDDIPEREMHAGASGGINTLLDPQPKSEVGTGTEILKVTAEPAVTPLTRNHFGVVVNGEGELQGKKDFANRKQSPTENSCRSFNSLASRAEVEQDLEGEVLVMDLPPENGSKETPASVEPEQRTHANNSDEEPSVQEQLRDVHNDLRVQATNNENDSSVQDPAEHLRDQDDASVHRRNNDGPLAEVPLGETDDERADPNDVLLQGRSGDGFHHGQEGLRDQVDDASVHRRDNDGSPAEAPLGETDEERADPYDALLQDSSGYGSHQGQDGAASGITHDQRGKKRSVLSDSPYLTVEATSTLQASQRSGQRNLLTYRPRESAVAAATSTKFRLSMGESEDITSSVNQQSSEVNSERVSEHGGILPGRRRTRQRSSGEPASPQSADVSDTQTSQQESLGVSERGGRLPERRRTRQRSSGEPVSPQSADVSDTQTSQQESLGEGNTDIDHKQYAKKAQRGKGFAGKTKTANKGASNQNITMDGCSGTVIIGNRNSLVTYRSTRKCESNGNTVQEQHANKARTRKGSADNTETTENEDASNDNLTIKNHSGSLVLGHDNTVTEYE